MKLESVRIQNFRGFKDQTVEFGDYTCLVGPNGSGKSTVLAALNIFFRHQATGLPVTTLSEQDFHTKDTSEPVVITVTFRDLSEDAAADLSAYVRQDKLVVMARAEWDEDSQSAPVQQFGLRMVMEAFSEYFERDKEGAYVPELKSIYATLRKAYSDLPAARTKADMESALREYEEEHKELCSLQESPDQFYGFTKGANRVGAHCQWVFVPAVKDASEEEIESRNSALGELLQRTVRRKVNFDDNIRTLQADLRERYFELIASHQDVLTSLSESIESRLQEWAHPGARVQLHWHYDPGKSISVAEPVAKADVGEGGFLGDLSRLGHGLQRSFIVSLLHELAEEDPDGAPTLILGIEEPELYQHPPQARHLAAVLERLSEEDAQVMTTTHSPYFVSGRGFENVRMVRKEGRGGGASVVSQVSHAQLAKVLAEALGEEPAQSTAVMATVEQILQPSQNELFFSRVPILVEGVEDIAFFSTHLQLTRQWEDFRRWGCHFVVSEGKGKMSRPLAIALQLGIPVFAVFDGDGHDNAHEAEHRRDNGCLLQLCGCGAVEVFPREHYFGDRVVMWGETIGRGVIDAIGEEVWEEAENEARSRYGLEHGIRRKNTLLIAGTLEVLAENAIVSSLLQRLTDQVRSFSEAAR